MAEWRQSRIRAFAAVDMRESIVNAEAAIAAAGAAVAQLHGPGILGSLPAEAVL